MARKLVLDFRRGNPYDVIERKRSGWRIIASGMVRLTFFGLPVALLYHSGSQPQAQADQSR